MKNIIPLCTQRKDSLKNSIGIVIAKDRKRKDFNFNAFIKFISKIKTNNDNPKIPDSEKICAY